MFVGVGGFLILNLTIFRVRLTILHLFFLYFNNNYLLDILYISVFLCFSPMACTCFCQVALSVSFLIVSALLVCLGGLAVTFLLD